MSYNICLKRRLSIRGLFHFVIQEARGAELKWMREMKNLEIGRAELLRNGPMW